MENERVDDLQCRGLKIIQDPGRFCFGMDAVLLTAFTRVRPGCRVLDLCTGTAVIPLLLAGKTEAKDITGIELQPETVEMACRSIEMNGLKDRISIMEMDVKDIALHLKGCSYDCVTCNPPYMAGTRGLTNPNESVAIARHEIKCTLEDVLKAARYALKPGRSLFMVHRPARLGELICRMSAMKLEPKRMRLVHPFVNREPNMVLIEATLGGNPGMRVEPPLIVYSSPGVYTPEVAAIHTQT